MQGPGQEGRAEVEAGLRVFRAWPPQCQLPTSITRERLPHQN